MQEKKYKTISIPGLKFKLRTYNNIICNINSMLY